MAMGIRAAALLALVIALPAALGTAAPLDGQQASRFERGIRPTGWIGITLLQTDWEPGAASTPTAMVIDKVYQGSPAQRAGLQVGDSIVLINQRPVSEEALARLQTSLQPGTEVSFQVLRVGRLRTVQVEAGVRPPDDQLVLPPQVRIQVETTQARLLQRMDSAARMGLLGGSAGPSRTLVMLRAPGDSMVLTFPGPSGVAHVPFENAFDGSWTIVFGTPPAPFEGVIGRQPTSTLVAGDARRAGVEVNRPTVPPLEAMRREMEAVGQALEARENYRRPLAPFMYGRDVIAGAKLEPLNGNASLSGYFGVSRGLLVLSVVEDTQFDEAGVVPGDVIVASGQRSVATIEELAALFRGARGAQSLPLTLVRQTRRIEVAVPR